MYFWFSASVRIRIACACVSPSRTSIVRITCASAVERTKLGGGAETGIETASLPAVLLVVGVTVPAPPPFPKAEQPAIRARGSKRENRIARYG